MLPTFFVVRCEAIQFSVLLCAHLLIWLLTLNDLHLQLSLPVACGMLLSNGDSQLCILLCVVVDVHVLSSVASQVTSLL